MSVRMGISVDNDKLAKHPWQEVLDLFLNTIDATVLKRKSQGKGKPELVVAIQIGGQNYCDLSNLSDSEVALILGKSEREIREVRRN